jgi:hypothetical protein
MKVSDGSGVLEEENIDVMEMYLTDRAYAMITSGEIKKAKTIILLQHA